MDSLSNNTNIEELNLNFYGCKLDKESLLYISKLDFFVKSLKKLYLNLSKNEINNTILSSLCKSLT